MVKSMGQRKIKNKEYNHHNDYRFPLSLMHQGFFILEKHGEGAFDRFAQEIRMPADDVERIRNKYLYKTDPDFRDKIGIKIAEIKAKIGVQLFMG